MPEYSCLERSRVLSTFSSIVFSEGHIGLNLSICVMVCGSTEDADVEEENITGFATSDVTVVEDAKKVLLEVELPCHQPTTLELKSYCVDGTAGYESRSAPACLTSFECTSGTKRAANQLQPLHPVRPRSVSVSATATLPGGICFLVAPSSLLYISAGG